MYSCVTLFLFLMKGHSLPLLLLADFSLPSLEFDRLVSDAVLFIAWP